MGRAKVEMADKIVSAVKPMHIRITTAARAVVYLE